jgi:hypothetical protein
VHIRHRVRRLDDAGQFRDIDRLLKRAVLGRVRDQRARREHHTGHPHPPMPGDDEPVGRLFSDLHRSCPSEQFRRPIRRHLLDALAARGWRRREPGVTRLGHGSRWPSWCREAAAR